MNQEPQDKLTLDPLLMYPIEEFKGLIESPCESNGFLSGQCDQISADFKALCERRYRILDMEVAYYPDGDHSVNLRGNTVIDWTVRQFSSFRDAPFPFIYELEKEDCRGRIHYKAGKGCLAFEWKKENENLVEEGK